VLLATGNQLVEVLANIALGKNEGAGKGLAADLQSPFSAGPGQRSAVKVTKARLGGIAARATRTNDGHEQARWQGNRVRIVSLWASLTRGNSPGEPGA
jgi:hypothetical protein